MDAMTYRLRSDVPRRDGALLVETAVAMLLLAVIGGGLLAVSAATSGSVAAQQRVVDANLQLRAAAETLRGADYQPCPDADYTAALDRFPPVQVVEVTVTQLDDGQVSTSSCRDADDRGVQLVQLRVQAGSAELSTVVAKAGWEGR